MNSILELCFNKIINIVNTVTNNIYNYFSYNSPIIISIDGNIGSGKSTLINYLKFKYKTDQNITFIDEPVNQWIETVDQNNNNILQCFYNDKSRWSYTFQNFAFITRATMLINAINQNKTPFYSKRKILITERSVETDRNVFAKMLYDDKFMSELEYLIYKSWYNTLFPEIKVNNIIYIRTLPETAFNRMNTRNRQEEANVPKSYIQMVHRYHDDWLNNHNLNYNICYLDGNTDKERNFEIMTEYHDLIERFIYSLS